MKISCPFSPSKRERRKEERPGEIVAAALKVFVSHGFAATRMEDVAKEAGVAKGTVFRYFPTKEDLFKAMVQTRLSDQFGAWQARVNAYEGSSAHLVLESMLEWWAHVGSTPAAGISRLFMQEAKHFPELAEHYHRTVIEPGRQIVRSIFDRGVRRGEFRQADVDALNALFMAPLLLLATTCLDASSRHTLLAGGQTPEQLIRQLADILVKGLQIPTGEAS
jgi:TetR/AcrR family transcriptional regulator